MVVIIGIGRRHVLMEALGKSLINVGDHGILFPFFIISWVKEHAIQSFTVCVFILDQFGLSPGKVFLEGIDIADFYGFFISLCAVVKIGTLAKGFFAVNECGPVFRFSQAIML